MADKKVEDEVSQGGFLSITLVSKFYGPYCAIRDVNLDVGEGELIALLGPSGSGKSTLLMAIAGFEQPTSGDIRLCGNSLIGLPPHKRGIGMVFQKYALFPHMSVAENIAYPLRRRNISRDQIAKSLDYALSLIQLDHLRTRLPSQLSGGQQQRVALARSLVFEPSLLLLDEPLGALDRKLRREMQSELKRIHQKVGTTMLLVTHDQEEALSLADRIAVLDGGRIQQFGTPMELYERPRTAFVANFVGESNLLKANVTKVNAACWSIVLQGTGVEAIVEAENVCAPASAGSVLLGVRPENVILRQAVKGPGEILQTNYFGSTMHLTVRLGPHVLSVRVPANEATALVQGANVEVAFAANGCRLYAEQPSED